jgi:hypothetical protein
MAMAGGAMIGLGMRIPIFGIPGTGGIGGAESIFRSLARGAIQHAAHEGTLGISVGLSVMGPGGQLSDHAIREGQLNSDRRIAAIENCKKQYPNANHSLSSLNF